MTAFTSRTSNCLYAAIDAGKSSATRRVSAPGKVGFDGRCGLLDPAQLLDVLGNVLPRCVEQREHADAAAQVGPALEQQPERLQPPRHVLRRVGAVDSEDQQLRPLGLQLALAGEHRLAARQALELGRVDRDRMRGHTPFVRLEPEAAAGVEERAPPALGVEAGDVAREQPFVDRADDRLRQHRPLARRRPRECA